MPRSGSCRLLLVLAVLIPATASGQSVPDDLDRLERRIREADRLPSRRAAVGRWIEAAAHPSSGKPDALNEAEQKLVNALRSEAETALTPVVGRYSIWLVPEAAEDDFADSDFSRVMDAAYLVLKRLLGHDVVEARGQRLIHFHRSEIEQPIVDKEKLVARYALPLTIGKEQETVAWLKWPTFALTRAIAGTAPGRFAIEGMPAAGVGLARWAEIYVARHMPEARVTEEQADELEKTLRATIRRVFFTGDRRFRGITETDAAGGLWVELLQATTAEDSDEPYEALKSTFHELNESPLPPLGENAPLRLLQLLKTFEEAVERDIWRVLRRYNAGVDQGDTENFRDWRRQIGETLKGESLPSGREMEQVRAWAVAAFPKGGYLFELADQSLQTLERKLAAAGKEADARRIRAARPLALNFDFLGPFEAEDVQAALEQDVLDTAATTRGGLTRSKMIFKRWKSLDPAHDDQLALDGRIPAETGSYGFLWATVELDRSGDYWVWLSPAGAVELWVNGVAAGEALWNADEVNRNVRRPRQVQLKRGYNTILLKIVSDGRPPAVFVRIGPSLSAT